MVMPAALSDTPLIVTLPLVARIELVELVPIDTPLTVPLWPLITTLPAPELMVVPPRRTPLTVAPIASPMPGSDRANRDVATADVSAVIFASRYNRPRRCRCAHSG